MGIFMAPSIHWILAAALSSSTDVMKRITIIIINHIPPASHVPAAVLQSVGGWVELVGNDALKNISVPINCLSNYTMRTQTKRDSVIFFNFLVIDIFDSRSVEVNGLQGRMGGWFVK